MTVRCLALSFSLNDARNIDKAVSSRSDGDVQQKFRDGFSLPTPTHSAQFQHFLTPQDFMPVRIGAVLATSASNVSIIYPPLQFELM